MSLRTLLRFGASVLFSFAMHGAAWASLEAQPTSLVRKLPSAELEFTPLPPPPPPKQETPVVPPPEPPKPALQPKLVRTSSAPPAEPSAPKVEAEEPKALSGTTLTNDTGVDSFSSLVGDGTSMDAPLRVPQARPLPQAPAPKPVPPRPVQPSIVPMRDLSSRPRPPSLEQLLRGNYPRDARSRGLSGTARVRARIDPDGRVRRANVLSESHAGFGSACQRTLVGSQWSAPRDRTGNAVATEISYTCRFVVEQ